MPDISWAPPHSLPIQQTINDKSLHLFFFEYWEYLSFMVKVNILQFIINDKTLHLLFSFTHWQCTSGSRHGYQISSGGDENCQI